MAIILSHKVGMRYVYTRKRQLDGLPLGHVPSVTPSGESIPGAKRPSYSIVYDAEDLTQFFTEVNITEENGIPYLNALFKGKKPIFERVLKLDADRYKKGDLPLSNMLSKYSSYIVTNNSEM